MFYNTRELQAELLHQPSLTVLVDYRDHLPDEPDPEYLTFPFGRAEKSGHCATGLFSLLMRYVWLEPGDTAVSIYFTLGGQAVSTPTALEAYSRIVPAVAFGFFSFLQQTTFRNLPARLAEDSWTGKMKFLPSRVHASWTWRLKA